jgi:hypothetical protein
MLDQKAVGLEIRGSAIIFLRNRGVGSSKSLCSDGFFRPGDFDSRCTPSVNLLQVFS